MTVQTLTQALSSTMALSEPELIRKGLLALIEKEIRLAELEIAGIRERYDVFSRMRSSGRYGMARSLNIRPGRTISSGRTRSPTLNACAK